MPTEAEFEEFFNTIHEKGNLFETLSRDERLEERWPLKQDLQDYLKWEDEKKMREDEMNEWFIAKEESEEFVDIIANTTNFFDMYELNKIFHVTLKVFVPLIPVGVDDDNMRYRMVPESDCLIPDREAPPVQGEIVEEYLLGVNTNVQPPIPEKPSSRSKFGLPEMSTDSNEFDNWKGGGFVFFQLGYLETQMGDEEDPVWDDDDSLWHRISWQVVIRLSSDGAPDGIYIMYDFYPVDDRINERHSEKITSDSWGHFHLYGQHGPQFSMARIADNIKEFGCGYKLNFTEMIEHPVEIVRVVRTSSGSVVRATVSRD